MFKNNYEIKLTAYNPPPVSKEKAEKQRLKQAKREAYWSRETRSKKQATNWRMGAIDDSSRVNMQPAEAMAMQWEPSV